MGPRSKLVVIAATVAYPVVVYLGFGRWQPLWLGLALAALLLLRAWSARDGVWLAAGLGAALLSLASQWGGSWVPLKLYPVMVSAVLLGVFAASLARPPTIVERIARLTEPQLPPEAIAYTRKVTLAWCGFFIVNGAVAAATVAWGSDEAWLLYNGLLSYLLMGAFFSGEWLLRQRMRSRLAAVPASHG